jgi:hypothetical protein
MNALRELYRPTDRVMGKRSIRPIPRNSVPPMGAGRRGASQASPLPRVFVTKSKLKK